jgi:GcrA cell cycle regulator
MNEDTKSLDISALAPAADHSSEASRLPHEYGPWPLAVFQPVSVESSDVGAEPVQTKGRRKKITTLHLNSRTCRWPIGDPVRPDFHYCGDLPVSGRNYCQKHEAMSFQPASRRRSAP